MRSLDWSPSVLSIILLSILALTPIMTGPLALGLGIAYALLFRHPNLRVARSTIKTLLGWSIVGLGAGMNFKTVAQVGIHGFWTTFLGIAFALVLGWFITKMLHSEHESSVLIVVGTAICGGSAIAAMAPVIRAKSESVSVALGVVFILNAIALLIFPYLGHLMGFSESQFGLWSALAIHDTSSVVGATLQYGSEALRIGTTVKLSRALWIVPLALLSSFFISKRNSEQGKIAFPWFILGFVLSAAFFSYFVQFQNIGHGVKWMAKRSFVLTLFLIGTTLSVQNVKAVGFKPVVLGVVLWSIILTTSAIAISIGILKI